ncbi:MAG: hypothetical protein QG649_64 [Patescibacteria group bacterium]|jgi:hypothetical protein|nr:hypothetical protein [Patescibacteria group bacterium]
MPLEVKKRFSVPGSDRSPDTLPQRTLKREQRRASIRRIGVTCSVLAVIVVTGGLVYTWYIGRQQPAQAAEPLASRSTRPLMKPTKVASDAPIGAAVQTSTQEVKLGENASVTVRTNPEAECSIVVKYKDIPAVDSGLIPKIADEFGVVSWAWTVRPDVPSGKWPAEVTCKNKKHSAFVRAEISIN